LATQFKTSNVISEEICAIVDDLTSTHLRKIAYIRPKGEEEVNFWIATYDFTLARLIEPEPTKNSGLRKKRKTKKQKTFREKKERSVVFKNR